MRTAHACASATSPSRTASSSAPCLASRTNPVSSLLSTPLPSMLLLSMLLLSMPGTTTLVALPLAASASLLAASGAEHIRPLAG